MVRILIRGVYMFKIKAMVHSKNALDEVTILHVWDYNNVEAEYKGIHCSAIFNPFVSLYYVDDVYGVKKGGGKNDIQ
jgi:hypothetical protein